MEFLRRAARLTLLISLILIPLSAYVISVRFALGLLAGTVWSLANLWTVKALVARTVGSRRTPRWQRVGLFAVKFPLLYGLGGWLVLSSWSSPVGFLVGFSLWQVCLVWCAGAQAVSS